MTKIRYLCMYPPMTAGVAYSQVEKLPPGNAGIDLTVKRIREQIHRGIESPYIRNLAVEIVQTADVQPHDVAGEVAAVFSWVRKNVRYTKDPTRVELLPSAENVARVGAEDCDGYTILISSLLGALGRETRLRVVGQVPGQLTHIFPEVYLAGSWKALDATPKNLRAGRIKFPADRIYGLEGFQMVGQLMTRTAVRGVPVVRVVVNGNTLYRAVAQATVDYLRGELSSGRMSPGELSRYLAAIPLDKTLTPLMKNAILEAVEAVGLYEFGLTPQVMKTQAAVAGMYGLGDLGFLGGVFNFVKKAVSGVANVAKRAIGIPEGQPVKVNVELPPNASPQPIDVGPAKVQLRGPSTAGVVVEQAKQFFTSPIGLGLLALGAFFVLPRLFGRRRR